MRKFKIFWNSINNPQIVYAEYQGPTFGEILQEGNIWLYSINPEGRFFQFELAKLKEIVDDTEKKPIKMVRMVHSMQAHGLKIACYQVRDPNTMEFGIKQYHMTWDNFVVGVLDEQSAKLFANFINESKITNKEKELVETQKLLGLALEAIEDVVCTQFSGTGLVNKWHEDTDLLECSDALQELYDTKKIFRGENG